MTPRVKPRRFAILARHGVPTFRRRGRSSMGRTSLASLILPVCLALLMATGSHATLSARLVGMPPPTSSTDLR